MSATSPSWSPGQTKLKEWRLDPLKFVYENFKVEPDLWQIDGLKESGGTPNPRRRIGMKACTGPGKSTELSWLGWHRLACFGERGEHPKGAALSGEGRDNLRDNLWAELAKWQNRSEFLKKAFTWNQERITANNHPETWFLSARSYPKGPDAEAIGRSLSGLHSKYPFILLDEIGDMPITVGQKATQIFTGGVVDALIAGAGNPTSVDGLLFHIFQNETALWRLITVTADPDDPKRTPRVDIEHAREQIRLHGRENPWVMATILGQFPPSSINALLGVEEVMAAMGKHLRSEQYSHAQKRLGIDVARFGDDRTVIFPRQGLAAFPPTEMRNARSGEIAARIARIKSEFQSEVEFIDDTGGFGAGTIDSLLQAGYSPQGIHFASKASDPRYHNRRAEMWFEMAEWVKRGGSLPNVPELVKELTTPTYTFQNGRFLIEPKDQIKERLGYSPDYADALALTFAMPEMPASSMEGNIILRENTSALHEYDPFAIMDL